MVLHANLASAQGRRRFINCLVSASRDGERVVQDLVTDERGMVAAVFPAKPDNRVYYLERVSADETEGGRLLVLRPNRTKRLTRNPVKLMQGEPYETSASPQTFVHALPTESLVQRTEFTPIRRWVLENLRLGDSRTLLKRQQVRSDRQLGRLYRRFFG